MASVEKTDERSPQPVIVHLDMPQVLKFYLIDTYL